MLAPTLEFSYKNDDLGDPMINDYLQLQSELQQEKRSTRSQSNTFKVNEVLRKFFDEAGIELIDFKIEFGRFHGEIILADEIHRIHVVCGIKRPMKNWTKTVSAEIWEM